MSRTFLLALLIATCLWPRTVAAVSVSLGTHLGLTCTHGGGSTSGSSNALAWPSSILTYQPGLRLATPCGGMR